MSTEPVLFLFVAQGGWRRKGLRLVLEACEQLSEATQQPWHLEILGMPGKGEDELLLPYDKEVRSGIIVPLGFQRDVDTVYARADVLVIGSYYEAFSLVMLEALSHGLPIITTPVNGAREAVREGWNGFTVDWKAAEMSLAMCTLMHDADLRKKMGHNSREWAEQFQLERIVEKTEAAYLGARHV